MPGPKSSPAPKGDYTPEENERRATVKPNAKTAARIATREASYALVPAQVRGGFCSPGSQNRKK